MILSGDVKCSFLGSGVLKSVLSELAPQFDVHANQITQWKSQLLEGAVGVFGGAAKADPAAAVVDLKTLHAKIGILRLENGFLEGAVTKAGLLSAKRSTPSTIFPSSNKPCP